MSILVHISIGQSCPAPDFLRMGYRYIRDIEPFSLWGSWVGLGQLESLGKSSLVTCSQLHLPQLYCVCTIIFYMGHDVLKVGNPFSQGCVCTHMRMLCILNFSCQMAFSSAYSNIDASELRVRAFVSLLPALKISFGEL